MRRIAVVAFALGAVLALSAQAVASEPLGRWFAAHRGAEVSAQAPRVDVVGNDTLRVWGDNRYETAVALSRAAGWSRDDAYIVYLANGDRPADALALGPSTFELGPLLFARGNDLPAVTRDELSRLRPCLIVAAGGSAVLSNSVLRAADSYARPADAKCTG